MFREKWDITETNKTEKDHFISTITSKFLFSLPVPK